MVIKTSYVSHPKISMAVYADDEVIIDADYKTENDIGFVTSLTLKHMLSGIPSAELTLACGLDVSTMNTTGPAYHSLLKKAIEKRLGVGLYLEYDQQDIKSWSESVEPERKCIFKGYIAKHTFQRTETNVAYSLTLIHWISDLALLNLLSPLSHPENPMDLALHAYFQQIRNPESEGTPAGAPQWFPSVEGLEELNKHGNLPEALRLFMRSTLTNINEKVKSGVSARIYNRVLAAIDHLKTQDSHGNELVRYHPETLGYAKTARVPEGIRMSISGQLAKELTNTTAWSLLTQKCLPTYNMELVAGIDNAWFIPAPICIFDESRADKWINIALRELISVTRQHAVNPVLGGVALYHPANESSPTFSDKMTLSYPEKFQEGPMLAAQLPSWLSLAYDAYAYSQAKLGILSQYVDSLEEDSSESYTSTEQQEMLSEDEARNSCIAIAKRYVKQIYLQRVIQARQVAVTTPARFDITPGSIVHIECPPDRFVEENVSSSDTFQPALIGVVTSVVITFPVAGAPTTQYTLGHVRDEIEAASVFKNTEPVFFSDYFCNKESGVALWQ